MNFSKPLGLAILEVLSGYPPQTVCPAIAAHATSQESVVLAVLDCISYLVRIAKAGL